MGAFYWVILVLFLLISGLNEGSIADDVEVKFWRAFMLFLVSPKFCCLAVVARWVVAADWLVIEVGPFVVKSELAEG